MQQLGVGPRATLWRGDQPLEEDAAIPQGPPDQPYVVKLCRKKAAKSPPLRGSTKSCGANATLHQVVLLMTDGPCFLRCPEGSLIGELLEKAGLDDCELVDPFTLQTVPLDKAVRSASVFDARPVIPAITGVLNTDTALWNTLLQIYGLADAGFVRLVPPACAEVLLSSNTQAWGPLSSDLQGEHLLMLFCSQGHWACLEAVETDDCRLSVVAFAAKNPCLLTSHLEFGTCRRHNCPQ